MAAGKPAAISPQRPTSPFFSPIPEHEEVDRYRDQNYKHEPTPLYAAAKSTPPARSIAADDSGDDRSVSCTNCRPSSRDKISIVPLDINGLKHPNLSPNPNSILRSLFLSLTRRSPRSSAASAAAEAAEWKLAAAELSRKLIHVTRKRDEALLEASRLKYSLSELQRRLDRLESLHPAPAPAQLAVQPFLRAVSDARSAVRHLSRALSDQIRLGAAGPRVLNRVAALCDSRAPGRSLLFYMEALLNRVFYSEFEAVDEGAALDPEVRTSSNRAAWEAVRSVGWEEVLSKGTRHYSEGLSRFCDRRMSEVVGMLGWARAWPEGLLQAFFGAAKGAWGVHLLARSVHPAVPVLRTERGARFEPGFMEDAAAGRAERPVPVKVRMMVAPGFYVYGGGSGRSCGVVKCKVLCSYDGDSSITVNSSNCNRSGMDSEESKMAAIRDLWDKREA